MKHTFLKHNTLELWFSNLNFQQGTVKLKGFIFYLLSFSLALVCLYQGWKLTPATRHLRVDLYGGG